MISSGGLINVPQGIEIENGKIFLANGRGQDLIAVDPVNGQQMLISQGGYFSDPVGLSMAVGPFIYVADSNALGSGAVLKVNIQTGAQTLIASGGYLNNLSDIALDAHGRLLVSE